MDEATSEEILRIQRKFDDPEFSELDLIEYVETLSFDQKELLLHNLKGLRDARAQWDNGVAQSFNTTIEVDLSDVEEEYEYFMHQVLCVISGLTADVAEEMEKLKLELNEIDHEIALGVSRGESISDEMREKSESIQKKILNL